MMTSSTIPRGFLMDRSTKLQDNTLLVSVPLSHVADTWSMEANLH
jgi:hypothetical protein